MFYNKNFFVLMVAAILVSTHLNYCSVPVTRHAAQASDINYQLEIEKNIKPRTFKYDNDQLAFTLKLESFEGLIKKDRAQNPNTFTTAHRNKVNDLEDTLNTVASTLAEGPHKGTLGHRLAELNRLKEKVLDQLDSAYDLLNIYNQKTTSAKTRISNLFKKQGTERSTTSAEEKKRLKTMIPDVTRSLINLKNECMTMLASLKRDMAQYSRIEQSLLLIQIFIQNVLYVIIQNGIDDLNIK